MTYSNLAMPSCGHKCKSKRAARFLVRPVFAATSACAENTCRLPLLVRTEPANLRRNGEHIAPTRSSRRLHAHLRIAAENTDRDIAVGKANIILLAREASHKAAQTEKYFIQNSARSGSVFAKKALVVYLQFEHGGACECGGTRRYEPVPGQPTLLPVLSEVKIRSLSLKH